MPSGNHAKLLRIFEKTTLQAKVNISFKPGAQKVNVSTFSESNERETLQMDFKITARCHVLKCILFYFIFAEQDIKILPKFTLVRRFDKKGRERE